MADTFVSRRELARRWGCSLKTIDRLRCTGRLAWVDLGARGTGTRPTIRFRMSDILVFEHSRCVDGQDNGPEQAA